MKLRNKLAVGFAVLTMGGTALASDASADRASLRSHEAASQGAPRSRAPADEARKDRTCDRMDCCAMRAPATSTSVPAFSDLG